MATKHDLGRWIVDALRDEGGAARLVDICRHVWVHHEQELRQSGTCSSHGSTTSAGPRLNSGTGAS